MRDKKAYATDEMIDLFARGMSVRVIGAAVGLAPRAVWNRLRNSGYRRAWKLEDRLTADQVARALYLRDRGFGPKRIARFLKCGHRSVRRFLKARDGSTRGDSKRGIES